MKTTHALENKETFMSFERLVFWSSVVFFKRNLKRSVADLVEGPGDSGPPPYLFLGYILLGTR